MVDRQHRPGAHTGSAGHASSQDANIELRERLRKLAVETQDLSKDPYFMRNHLGTYECRLCLTLHSNEGSYLAHTQGKKHQTNLSRRNAKENKEPVVVPNKLKPALQKTNKIKIGRPGYRVIKASDPNTGQKQITFEIQYAEIEDGSQPRYRIMSAYEQKVEVPEKQYQYLLFAAEPYDTIAFKIPNIEIDHGQDKFQVSWEKDKKSFSLALCFKLSKGDKNLPSLPPKPPNFGNFK